MFQKLWLILFTAAIFGIIALGVHIGSKSTKVKSPAIGISILLASSLEICSCISMQTVQGYYLDIQESLFNIGQLSDGSDDKIEAEVKHNNMCEKYQLVIDEHPALFLLFAGCIPDFRKLEV